MRALARYALIDMRTAGRSRHAGEPLPLLLIEVREAQARDVSPEADARRPDDDDIDLHLVARRPERDGEHTSDLPNDRLGRDHPNPGRGEVEDRTHAAPHPVDADAAVATAGRLAKALVMPRLGSVDCLILGGVVLVRFAQHHPLGSARRTGQSSTADGKRADRRDGTAQSSSLRRRDRGLGGNVRFAVGHRRLTGNGGRRGIAEDDSMLALDRMLQLLWEPTGPEEREHAPDIG
jgi:hypothetical protein